jgi:CRISPR-associated protein Cas2
MMILVTYDVSTATPEGVRRLRKVARVCRNYGQRVQFSVFELEVDHARWVSVKHQLCELIDAEVDSLRFYYLGLNWQRKVEHVGAKAAIDFHGPLVF